MFKIGINFELLYAQRQLCETFFGPNIFKDMKFVTYSTQVIKIFQSDFKVPIFSLDKLDACDKPNDRILDTFLLVCSFYLTLT